MARLLMTDAQLLLSITGQIHEGEDVEHTGDQIRDVAHCGTLQRRLLSSFSPCLTPSQIAVIQSNICLERPVWKTMRSGGRRPFVVSRERSLLAKRKGLFVYHCPHVAPLLRLTTVIPSSVKTTGQRPFPEGFAMRNS